MGIDVRWETETGGELEVVWDEQDILSSLVDSGTGDAGATCLRFLDAWGEALFNQNQLPVLAVELAELETHLENQDEAAHVAKVLGLVQRANGEQHTYVRFSGG
jgi:hypothetical protein